MIYTNQLQKRIRDFGTKKGRERVKIRRKHRFRIKKYMVVFLLLSIGFVLGRNAEYKAATSYENAKEFYETTPSYKKAEAYCGDFYLATMAQLASSSTSLKFQTLGFDITLSGIMILVSSPQL